MTCSRTSTPSPGNVVAKLVPLAAALALAAAAAIAHVRADAPPSTLAGLASEFVRARAAEAGLRVKVVSIAEPQGTALPADLGDVRFRIAHPVSTGRVALTAVVVEGGRPVRSLVLTGEVIVEAEVDVAARDLPKGKVIEAGDVRTEVRALPEGLDPREVRLRSLGRETRADVPEGSILAESRLKQPREVVRGETVNLLAEGRGFSVRVLAIAGRDGVHGERIPVVNGSSGQTVIAEVAGRGLVRLTSPAALTGRLEE
jgi:flagella basal body P-ring formation protein FlgA